MRERKKMIVIKNEVNGKTLELTEEQMDIIFDALEEVKQCDEGEADDVQGKLSTLFFTE